MSIEPHDRTIANLRAIANDTTLHSLSVFDRNEILTAASALEALALQRSPEQQKAEATRVENLQYGERSGTAANNEPYQALLKAAERVVKSFADGRGGFYHMVCCNYQQAGLVRCNCGIAQLAVAVSVAGLPAAGRAESVGQHTVVPRAGEPDPKPSHPSREQEQEHEP